MHLVPVGRNIERRDPNLVRIGQTRRKVAYVLLFSANTFCYFLGVGDELFPAKCARNSRVESPPGISRLYGFSALPAFPPKSAVSHRSFLLVESTTSKEPGNIDIPPLGILPRRQISVRGLAYVSARSRVGLLSHSHFEIT